MSTDNRDDPPGVPPNIQLRIPMERQPSVSNKSVHSIEAKTHRRGGLFQCDGRCSTAKELELKNHQMAERLTLVHERLKRVTRVESSILDLHVEVQEWFSDADVYSQVLHPERQRAEAMERCKGDPLVLVEMLRANLRVQFMAKEMFERDLRHLIAKAQANERDKLMILEEKMAALEKETQRLLSEKDEALHQVEEFKKQKDGIASSSANMLESTRDSIEKIELALRESEKRNSKLQEKLEKQESLMKTREEEALKVPQLQADLLKLSSAHEQERHKYIQVCQQQQQEIDRQIVALSKAKADNEGLQQEMNQVKMQVKSLKACVAMRKIKEAEDKAERSEKLAMKAKEDLERLRKELTESKNAIVRKSAIVQALQKELSSLRSDAGIDKSRAALLSNVQGDSDIKFSPSKMKEILDNNPYLQDFYKEKAEKEAAAQAKLAKEEAAVAMKARPFTAGSAKKVQRIPSASELLKDFNRSLSTARSVTTEDRGKSDPDENSVILLVPGTMEREKIIREAVSSVSADLNISIPESRSKEFDQVLQGLEKETDRVGLSTPGGRRRKSSITSVIQGRLRPATAGAAIGATRRHEDEENEAHAGRSGETPGSSNSDAQVLICHQDVAPAHWAVTDEENDETPATKQAVNKQLEGKTSDEGEVKGMKNLLASAMKPISTYAAAQFSGTHGQHEGEQNRPTTASSLAANSRATAQTPDHRARLLPSGSKTEGTSVSPSASQCPSASGASQQPTSPRILPSLAGSSVSPSSWRAADAKVFLTEHGGEQAALGLDDEINKKKSDGPRVPDPAVDAEDEEATRRVRHRSLALNQASLRSAWSGSSPASGRR